MLPLHWSFFVHTCNAAVASCVGRSSAMRLLSSATSRVAASLSAVTACSRALTWEWKRKVGQSTTSAKGEKQTFVNNEPFLQPVTVLIWSRKGFALSKDCFTTAISAPSTVVWIELWTRTFRRRRKTAFRCMQIFPGGGKSEFMYWPSSDLMTRITWKHG